MNCTEWQNCTDTCDGGVGYEGNVYGSLQIACHPDASLQQACRAGDGRYAMVQAKTQIASAMKELMRRKPVSRIRVVEICRAAGVGRQTFY